MILRVYVPARRHRGIGPAVGDVASQDFGHSDWRTHVSLSDTSLLY